MRTRIGILLAGIFYYSGLISLFRRRMSRSGKHLIILNYHNADANLRSHMLYLRRYYRVMHLEDALEWLYSPQATDEHDTRTPLVLTFDDGYHDNYTQAFAFAQELQIPITIFLIPGYLDGDGNRYFWWRESHRIVRRAGVKEVTLDGSLFHLDQPEERGQLRKLIDTHLRYAGSVAERDAFLHEIYDKLAVPSALINEDLVDQPMTWGEVLKMQESGLVSFGSHTMNHHVLSHLDSLEEASYEVTESRQQLQQNLGRDIRVFAYPVGKNESISDGVVEAVRKAGYSWAVMAINGIDTPQSDKLRLNRVLCDTTRHWLVMAAEASGLWFYLAPIWKSIIGK
jgi:peptidoglycan/xylan/chitin deacetylase (PgdA/CDA1 family)